MRNALITVALASTLAASPALARDKSYYVGVEGGLMTVEDVQLDFADDLTSIDEVFDIDHKTGFDVDVIAGYDFGMLRLEGELGYRRASVDDILVSPTLAPTGALGGVDVDGRTRVLSSMLNLLLDFGGNDGLGGFVGGGVGAARIKMRADVSGSGVPAGTGFSGSDSGFAWQAMAGVRAPITHNLDLGLKYRLFNAKFAFEDGGAQLDGRHRSHSLLASLVYNFMAPPPPAPPPPPAVSPPPPPPATHTCADGSVILATDMCPSPPPPPPPPPPAPERG